MSGHLYCKGYTGTIDYTPEDGVLFGKVVGIKSLLSYEGASVEDIKNDFMEAVDDYLEMCEAEGFEPEVPAIIGACRVKNENIFR